MFILWIFKDIVTSQVKTKAKHRTTKKLLQRKSLQISSFNFKVMTCKNRFSQKYVPAFGIPPQSPSHHHHHQRNELNHFYLLNIIKMEFNLVHVLGISRQHSTLIIHTRRGRRKSI